jgi:hypothetical protein
MRFTELTVKREVLMPAEPALVLGVVEGFVFRGRGAAAGGG